MGKIFGAILVRKLSSNVHSRSRRQLKTMVALTDTTNVKVYTVNGAASGSSSSLPDWLTRKRIAKKGKRAIKEHIEGTIDLIQEFQFPEASNKVRTTRDGHHAIATGVYKPQMRCYDLDQLTLKFERHTDAENVDFIVSEYPSPRDLRTMLKNANNYTRSCRMIGRRPFTCKPTVQSSSTHKEGSIIEREYHILAEPSTITSPPVML